MDVEYDFEAARIANIALGFIFGLVTLVTNFVLLVRLVRKRRILSSARHCIQMLLALGGILKAVVITTLSVLALDIVEAQMSCLVYTISSAYFFFFLPFVYGVSILLIEVDIVTRHKTQRPSGQSPLLCGGMAVLPWILALLIIVPLRLVGIDWSDCWDHEFNFTSGQWRSLMWFCKIVPSFFALLVGICLVCTRNTYHVTNLTSPSTDHPTEGLRVMELTSINPPGETRAPLQGQIQSQDQVNHDIQSLLQDQEQINVPGHTTIAPHNEPSPSVDTLGNPLAECLRTEKSLACAVASVLFLCIMPDTTFLLGYGLYTQQPYISNRDDRGELFIVSDVLFYLECLFPVFIPSIWATKFNR